MSKSFSGLIDDNPEKVLDLYLGDSKCAGHYAYLLSHTDYSKSLKDFDNTLSVLYFQISEWLEPVKISLKDHSYNDASNMCANCIDAILPKVKELNLFNYDQDLVNIDYIIMAYTQSILANLCQRYGRYKLGMDMYSEWLMLDSFIKVTNGWSYDEIVSQVPKNPKQVSAIRQKGVVIPLARIIWQRHDVSHLISPSTMAGILISLHSLHNDKTPRKRTIKNWLKQHKNITPEKVAKRLKHDKDYTLSDREQNQLEVQKLIILEKYKDSFKLGNNDRY